MQCRAAVTLRSAHAHACGHARRAIFEGGLLQGFDWIAWSVVGLQVPLAAAPLQLVLHVCLLHHRLSFKYHTAVGECLVKLRWTVNHIVFLV